MARCVLNKWQGFYRNSQESEEAPGLIVSSLVAGSSLPKNTQVSDLELTASRNDWPRKPADSLSDSGVVAHIGGQVLKSAGKIRSCRMSFTTLLGVRLGLLRGEHKELMVRRRRIEERAEVYLNINSECGGAGGMKDVEARIIIHDQGILFQRFQAVMAPSA